MPTIELVIAVVGDKPSSMAWGTRSLNAINKTPAARGVP